MSNILAAPASEPEPPAAPVITAITPDTWAAADSPQLVITGTGFRTDGVTNGVYLNPSSAGGERSLMAIPPQSATEITVTYPGGGGLPGPGTIQVRGGTAGASNDFAVTLT